MKKMLVSALFAGVCASAYAQLPVSTRHLAVRVYNLSGLPTASLDRATHEASAIFAKLNIALNWEVGDPDAAEAHTTDQSAPGRSPADQPRGYIAVRIGRGLSLHGFPGALGVSLPFAKYGVSATVFQDKVEDLSRTAGLDFSLILGTAIAHELGHVLLLSGEHSPSGLMRARLGKPELDLAAMGVLGFLPSQQAAIRNHGSLTAQRETARAEN